MKKVFLVIGAFVLAVLLVIGGYIAGQRVQFSSLTSAMPKHSLEQKAGGEAPGASISPDATMLPQQNGGQVPGKAAEERAISLSNTSAVDESWSKVSETSNATNNEALTLYTSAQKDANGFLWDDRQKWVIELSDGKGGYYTLYDQQVTNGTVYYEVAENSSGERVIYVYTVTTAGTSIMQYTRTSTGFTEKNVYNTGTLNRTFSSIPNYK